MTQRSIRYNNSSDLKRYTLKTGEEKEVTFTLSVEDHKFYDLDMNYIAKQEYLKFSIGKSSVELQKLSFSL